MSTEFFNNQWRIPSNENQNKVSKYSMDLDGSSDFIDCGDSNDFSFGNGSTDSPFSISAWVNMTDATSFVTIAKDATSNREYVIRTLTDDKLYIYLLDNVNGGYIGRISSGTVTSYQGTWIHTVYTYNGNSSSSGIKIYLNGSAVDNADYQGGSYTAMSNTTTSLNIGRQEIGTGTFANGKIDQVSVFNYTLSATQVASLGQAPLSVFDFNNSETINFGYISSLSNATKATFSFWVKKESSALNQIFGVQSSSFDRVGFVIPSSNTAAFHINGVASTINNFILNNGWHHIVIVWDASESVALDRVKIYLNNSVTSFGNASNPSSFNSINADFKIGQFSSQYLTGQLSNFQIFSTALPATGSNSVETLYNNGRPLPDMSSFTSLQGWWKLDDTATFNSSTSVWTIPDDSYNSNTGTSNGMNASNLVVSDINGELITNPMITSPKPIAYYQLGDQSAYNGANLLVPNNSLSGSEGYSPYALGFDGIDDYLTITSTDFKGSGGTVSYSFWVKPATYGNPPGTQNYGYFISDSSTGGGIAYSEGGTGFGLTPGQMYLYNMTNAGAVATTTSTIIDENVWNHIVVVFNTGNIVQFYKNGSLSSTLTGITSYNATFDTIAARGYSGGVNNPLNGELSNFSIFDTALTSTQVTEIYNQGVPSNLNTFSGTAPVAWWQLGFNSSFNSSTWTCLDEIGTNNAVSVNMTNDDITNGVGYSASGLGTSSIEIKGDAPYSTANGLSYGGMDVLDRTTDVPN